MVKKIELQDPQGTEVDHILLHKQVNDAIRILDEKIKESSGVVKFHFSEEEKRRKRRSEHIVTLTNQITDLKNTVARYENRIAILERQSINVNEKRTYTKLRFMIQGKSAYSSATTEIKLPCDIEKTYGSSYNRTRISEQNVLKVSERLDGDNLFLSIFPKIKGKDFYLSLNVTIWQDTQKLQIHQSKESHLKE